MEIWQFNGNMQIHITRFRKQVTKAAMHENNFLNILPILENQNYKAFTGSRSLNVFK